MFSFLDEKYNKAPRQFSSASQLFLSLSKATLPNESKAWMGFQIVSCQRQLMPNRQKFLSQFWAWLGFSLRHERTGISVGEASIRSFIPASIRPKSKLVGILFASWTKGKEQIKFPTSPATALTSAAQDFMKRLLLQQQEFMKQVFGDPNNSW